MNDAHLNEANLTRTTFCHAYFIDEGPLITRVAHERDGTPSGHQRLFSPTKLKQK
jgi:hypothetical protein